MNNTVLLSVGCNRDYETQMQRIRECLSEAFPDARFTASLLSPAFDEGEEAPPYSNMLVRFSTLLNEERLSQRLKLLEQECGDSKLLRSQGIVMMDLDILLFNNEKRHLRDWSRSYITTLLNKQGI